MLEFLTTYGWIIWVALILVFAIIEMLTLDFLFLMLGLGSVGGLIAQVAGAPWWVQIIVAAALAVVLLIFLRPSLLRHLKRGADPAKSNVEALTGQSGRALTEITHETGQARLGNGDVWTARIPDTDDAVVVKPGQQLTVLAIQGATAIVAPQITIQEESADV